MIPEDFLAYEQSAGVAGARIDMDETLKAVKEAVGLANPWTETTEEETTEENIVTQLLKEYEGEKEEVATLVSTYIEQLRKEDLLEE